ncbi:nitroreductase family protein [Peptostreptococcus porci]|uniref:nitroreductase family protein n=1 Tax=Peptostreptococcus porci TaxID=2652282 RepID=UPI002A8131E6|nr:nitroreductase family protein [Peptostreptococcus porci]MDY4128597.1 nitroreductase family protein [Peptostreptococcus porci]
MNFKELVISNRTCRRYDSSKKISREEMIDLVELARFTPSGINKQGLRFAVVCDDETNAKVYDNLGWAGYLKEWPGPIESERPTGYIVFLTDEEYGKPMAEDIGICSQTISLGARAEGMAACIFKSFKGEPIVDILGLDKERYKVILVMSIGYPVEEVVVDDIKPGDDIKYYRDEKQVHHVPKIVLEDLIVK